MMFPTDGDNASVLTVDLGLLIGLLVMARLLDPKRQSDRILFGLTAAAFLIIYALWRWHDTLPPLSFTAQSLWSILFFSFELIAITYTLLSIIILLRNRDRSVDADAAQKTMLDEDRYPAVDVFICTYDEPIEVVERSILAAQALDYPNFTVWVLDDTRRDWLREYCSTAGAQHVTRRDNTHAKAGNLNNGLAFTAERTNAPIILVLDADFAPRRDFLKRTVGLLVLEPDVAILQTPQFYYNSDPIQHNLLASTSWVDDQRFFFDVFQPAKDAWGCAFCVGTSFIVWRDLLQEIGGFPTEAISEDINLSYAMLRHGYRTAWLNEPLSFGLSAEGVPEYITQRTRWCLGTIQVALLRSGPFFGRGYTFTQRWHYLHGVLNWLCKPFMVLLLIAPPIYWFADLPAFEADYLSFLRYGIPALLAQVIYMGWVSRAKTLPIFMEATHAITSFAISATLVSAIFKPFGRPFKVTDKGGDRSAPRVHGALASIFGIIAASSAASIVWAFISPYAASEVSSLDFFNLLWAAVAMLIAFVAFLVCFELPRGDEKFEVAEDTLLRWADKVIPCRVSSLSMSSVQLVTKEPCDFDQAPSHLKLDGLGWTKITLAIHSGRALTARLEPDVVQRANLVLRLFSVPNGNVARSANLRSAVGGLVRRICG